MQHSIFISYRRDDSEGEAGRLYDDLVRAYGKDAVFMDVAGIAPGLDFRKAIDDNVAGCGVFLAVIGTQWTTITDADGKRRLDDANDFVRLEVASALARNIAVIPVLVHEARMPRPDQLPDNIKDLAYRNSVEISHARWDSDVKLLIDALRQYVTTSAATETQPVHATVPVQLPPPVSTEAPSTPTVTTLRIPFIVAGAAALLLLVVLGYFLTRPRSTAPAAALIPSPRQLTPGQENVLAGVWHNTQPVNVADSLIGLRIEGAGPSYNIEPFGRCPQGQCPWGVRTVILQGGRATGEWTPRNTPQEINEKRTVDLTLEPTGSTLQVTVRNAWTASNSQPHSNENQFIFQRTN